MNRGLLTLVVALTAILALYSLLVLASARKSAINVAQEQPYCIQVATATGYKRVSNSLELAGFFMRGSGPINHAVLVVGDPEYPRLYHWSYFENSFKEDAYGDPPIFCEPRPHFLNALEKYPEEKKEVFAFRYAGYKFEIPEPYEPRFNLPSFNGRQGLTFSAGGPGFEPRSGYRSSDILSIWFEVAIGYDTAIEAGRKKQNGETRVESLGAYKNLTKEKVHSAYSNSSSLQYYIVNEGKTTTIISCWESDNTSCSHRFYDGEFSYYFHHMPADLEKWREIQAKAKAVFASFISARPKCSPPNEMLPDISVKQDLCKRTSPSVQAGYVNR